MKVVYEDNHLIIINKACGELVQSDKTGDRELVDVLKEYVKEKYNKPGNVFLAAVHRLDRPTSGLVVFARTSKALARMALLFKERKIIKKYWAVVDKLPPKETDTLRHFLIKNEKQNKSYAYDEEGEGRKEGRLTYTLIKSSDNYHLLEIELHTGRHHQIRAQLATIGCKIKGDVKYNFPRANLGRGIHLHARYIEFVHPVKKELVSFTADVPDDELWKFFEGN